jgi:hypothetical protein
MECDDFVIQAEAWQLTNFSSMNLNALEELLNTSSLTLTSWPNNDILRKS